MLEKNFKIIIISYDFSFQTKRNKIKASELWNTIFDKTLNES